MAAGVMDGGNDRLAGEQIVAEKDRPQRWPTVAPCLASQRLAALRSQSCFAAPSCGAISSGGSGMTCLWPGATMLAPRNAW